MFKGAPEGRSDLSGRLGKVEVARVGPLLGRKLGKRQEGTFVARTLGLLDEERLGNSLGRNEGKAPGDKLGIKVVSSLGFKLGIEDGTFDGNAAGSTLGLSVGALLGSSVRKWFSLSLGSKVGCSEETSFGDKLKIGKESAVGKIDGSTPGFSERNLVGSSVGFILEGCPTGSILGVIE